MKEIITKIEIDGITYEIDMNDLNPIDLSGNSAKLRKGVLTKLDIMFSKQNKKRREEKKRRKKEKRNVKK